MASHLRDYSTAWRARLLKHVLRQLTEAGIHELPKMTEAPLHLAFIDVGWSGGSQLRLQQLLHSCDVNVIFEGLYVAIDSSSVRNAQRGSRVSGWLVASSPGGVQSNLIVNCKEIIEEACTNDIGAIVDYNAAGEAIHEDEKPMTIRQRAEQGSLRAGIDTFTDAYFNIWWHSGFFKRHPLRLATAAIRTLTARVVAFPTEDECDGLSAWLHEEGGHFRRHEPFVSELSEAIITYGTARQLYADIGNYWLLGAVSRVRPWITGKIIAMNSGYSPRDDFHVVMIPAQLTVATDVDFRTPASCKIEDVPAYVESDGCGLSYRVLFTDLPISLTWRGQTTLPYALEQIQLICRYTDGDRETEVFRQSDINSIVAKYAPGVAGVTYGGQPIPLDAPFLSSRRPREIAIYVGLRRQHGSIQGQVGSVEVVNAESSALRRWHHSNDQINLARGAVRTKDAIRAQGRLNGNILYGPYISIPAGRYRFSLAFAETPRFEHLVVDVTGSSGNMKFIELEYDASRPIADDEISFKFQLDDPAEAVEFRLHAIGDTDVAVAGYTLEQLGF